MKKFLMMILVLMILTTGVFAGTGPVTNTETNNYLEVEEIYNIPEIFLLSGGAEFNLYEGPDTLISEEVGEAITEYIEYLYYRDAMIFGFGAFMFLLTISIVAG